MITITQSGRDRKGRFTPGHRLSPGGFILPLGVLPPLAAKIFAALCQNPYGLTSRQLAAHIYNTADGGPDYAGTCIQVRVCNMNKKWAAENSLLRIRGQRGPGSKYQIRIAR